MPNSTQTDCVAVVPFSFNETPIRTINEDGQPWFVAKDVCAALEIAWSSATLRQIPAEWKGGIQLITPGGKQRLRSISEPAVYKLAFRSNKPEADKFTNWVASEVLPSIRKTGGYTCGLSTKADRRPLSALISTWVSVAPISHKDAWKQIHAHVGAKAEAMTMPMVKQALAFVQERIDKAIAPALPETFKATVPAATIKELNAMSEEFMFFLADTQKQLYRYSNRLTDITGPLYKDLIKVIGWDGQSLTSDSALDGLHTPHQEGVRQTENGLSMLFTAIRQAGAFAKMMNSR